MKQRIKRKNAELIDISTPPGQNEIHLTSLSGKPNFWDSLKSSPISFFIEDWLNQFDPETQKTYFFSVKKLEEKGLLNQSQTLETFKELPHEHILDQIKRIPEVEWKETTKQARAAMYLSFTGYLQRLSEGKIRKAIASKHGATKTFKKVREKVVSESLVQREWLKILDELKKINLRDRLIIEMCLHGGKRISEVLSLRVESIDFETRIVTFLQSKTRGFIKEVRITYPEDFMLQLKNYIGDRQGIVFITAWGIKKEVSRRQLNRSLKLAAKSAGIEKKISPHVFRTTLITYLRSQGFADSEIMKVTGHASSSMIAMYDKTSQADNPSKVIKFISWS